jgi:hypothetical protein
VSDFKQLSYKLGITYNKFWRDNRILSDMQILRMAEAELTSELLIAMTVGIRSRKVIESFYKKYENEQFPNPAVAEKRFHATMSLIGDMMGPSLSVSEFRRVHMFYTLFCSVFHMNYGLPELAVPRKTITAAAYAKTRTGLAEIEAIFQKDGLSDPERKFLDAARRATTDAAVRKYRSEQVCRAMVKALNA